MAEPTPLYPMKGASALDRGDHRLSSIETNGRVRTRLIYLDFAAHLMDALRTGQTGGVICATLIRLEDKALVDIFLDPGLLRDLKGEG